MTVSDPASGRARRSRGAWLTQNPVVDTTAPPETRPALRKTGEDQTGDSATAKNQVPAEADDALRNAAPAAPALAVEHVSYSFGDRRALDDVSLDLQAGRVTALLGPNGAGKTTLFSLITGLYACRQGEVRVAGHAMRTERTRALAELGIMFQAQTLDIDLTVEQNLRYFAALRGLSRRQARARIAELLDSVGLSGERKAKVRTLSGGQRRRVEVARALIDRPLLLLLDEPSTGLDIVTRRWLIQHVHDLAEKEGICVLLATHLVDEVAAGDDLIILDQGRIVARGRVEDVVRACGAVDLDQAFTTLTGQPRERSAGPAGVAR